MSTYLELVKDLREDLGVSGNPVTVVNQTGLLGKLCRYITKADMKIQLLWVDWGFLWDQWELVLTEGEAEYSVPRGLGEWDRSSFMLNAGTADVSPVSFMPYKDFRIVHSGEQSSGNPSMATVKPNRKLFVTPTPDVAGVKLRADYWKAPDKMMNNSDKSLIPEHFHPIIIARAKMMYAEYIGNSGLFTASAYEFSEILKRLESAELPERRTFLSEQEFPMTVRAV